MSSEKKNGPVKRFRAGQVAAAIWNEEVEFDGQRTTRASVTFQKRYQDRKTKEWTRVGQRASRSERRHSRYRPASVAGRVSAGDACPPCRDLRFAPPRAGSREALRSSAYGRGGAALGRRVSNMLTRRARWPC